MNTTHKISSHNSPCTKLHKTTISSRSLYGDTSRPPTSSSHEPDSTQHIGMKRRTPCDDLHPELSMTQEATTLNSPTRRRCISFHVTPKRIRRNRRTWRRRRLNFDVVGETPLEAERTRRFNQAVRDFCRCFTS